MDTNGFDLSSWIEGPQKKRALSSWDRERYARLPTYRELRRDVALAHGQVFIAALAALARGDATRAEGLARRLVDDGAARGCSPGEVVAAFQILQRAYRAQLAESGLADAEREQAERQLLGALLACSNALASALATRLTDAREGVAKVEAETRRVSADRDHVTALLDSDVREVVDAATAALIATRDPDDGTRSKVLAACEAMERLRDRAARLREVGRLENGATLKKARARLRDVLAGVARTWEKAARQRDVAIGLDADASAEVDADADLLTRALDGCLENALRYTPRRGEIRLVARRRGQRMVISVWDSGPPLHPDQRARVFDKYWTGAREAGAGRGLGLYLCRLVAERHGGEAWTDDEHGCCAFHLALPLTAQVEVLSDDLVDSAKSVVQARRVPAAGLGELSLSASASPKNGRDLAHQFPGFDAPR